MEGELAVFCFYIGVFFILFGTGAFLCEALDILFHKLEEKE